MEFILKNFWIAFIVVTFLNALTFKFRSIKQIKEKPELEEGYNKIIKGYVIYGSIPWIIMGIGNLLSLTNSIFEYFNPSTLNPIVLLFHISIIYLWIISSIWLYKKDGASFLDKHPGILNMTGSQLKLLLPLCLVGGIAAMVAMWIVEVPVMF